MADFYILCHFFGFGCHCLLAVQVVTLDSVSTVPGGHAVNRNNTTHQSRNWRIIYRRACHCMYKINGCESFVSLLNLLGLP